VQDLAYSLKQLIEPSNRRLSFWIVLNAFIAFNVGMAQNGATVAYTANINGLSGSYEPNTGMDVSHIFTVISTNVKITGLGV